MCAFPPPHICLLHCCLQRLSLSPSECLVVEDSVIGLQAALGAGMRCVITYTPSTKAQVSFIPLLQPYVNQNLQTYWLLKFLCVVLCVLALLTFYEFGSFHSLFRSLKELQPYFLI